MEREREGDEGREGERKKGRKKGREDRRHNKAEGDFRNMRMCNTIYIFFCTPTIYERSVSEPIFTAREATNGRITALDSFFTFV